MKFAVSVSEIASLRFVVFQYTFYGGVEAEQQHMHKQTERKLPDCVSVKPNVCIETNERVEWKNKRKKINLY